MSGAMMDLIRRRKILLSGASCTAMAGAKIPRARPTAIPIKIQAVREIAGFLAAVGIPGIIAQPERQCCRSVVEVAAEIGDLAVIDGGDPRVHAVAEAPEFAA